VLPRLTIAAAIVAAAVTAAPVEARHKDEGIVVQDLAYGEVLFDFFQDDYFDALTRLLAAEQRNEIPHHEAEAELMLGGLYLSYGEHRLAGEIFERVLAKSVDPALNDRCWFFLAKIWHERGYQPEAEAALGRITGALPQDLEQQRQMLTATRPVEARPSLERVRLEGPFSNKALLGVGWSDAETKNYRGALAPWLALNDRNLLDSAVQESLLAVPYAYAQLGAQKQAADRYVEAIDAFAAEINRLTTSIDAIEHGDLITELLGEHADAADASGWYWRLDKVPDTIESRYLYELMASNKFQEALKNYRDLRYLSRNLEHWQQSLGAFDDILDTRQRAYEQRLPTIDQSLGSVDLDAMMSHRVEFESRVQQIERTEDAVALGTEDQQKNWRKLTGMEAVLAQLPNDAESNELREKQAFLKGVLEWDLQRDYKARLWAERKSLGDLDRQLREAQRRHHEVQSARDDWPEKFAALTARIETLKPRVAGMQTFALAALDKQQNFLQAIAVNELKAQRDRLNTYMIQARFALASIYDRASASATPAGVSVLGEAAR